MSWQSIDTAPRDRPIRLARDNGCGWDLWVGMWNARGGEYPWLVLDAAGLNELPADRPDFWCEIGDVDPPYAIA